MKLAVICTHPIQYYSPWFAWMARHTDLDLHVFYLWDGRTRDGADPEFGHPVDWDRPLLEGHASTFVENTSRNPGTEQFDGIINPGLRGEIRRHNPDAVLMLTYNYRTPIEFIFRESSRYPLLFRGDSFDLERGGLKNMAKATAKQLIFKRFERILCVGELNRRYWRELGIADNRLYNSPHCVDNAAFRSDLLPAPRSDDGRIRFGFFGKFVRRKRVPDLIQAFRQLNDPGTELLLVGSGPDRPELEELSADDQRIQFHGFANQSEMPALYAACDVIVLPSDIETWGLCVNEAMAAGCAVVVSDRCGCSADLVSPGANGYTFRCGDVASLRKALQRTCEALRQGRNFGMVSQEMIGGYSYATATRGLLRALGSLS